MRFLLLLSLFLSTISCNFNNSEQKTVTEVEKTEEFQKLVFVDFNANLLRVGHFLTPEEVVKRYRKIDLEMKPLEENETIEVSNIRLGEGKYEVTLIHDNLADDSVKAEKYVMRIFRRKDIWQVYSLKRNWICWEGRGHQEWGIAKCK